MSHLTTTLRAATAAALLGGFAYSSAATATADPNTDTLAAALSKGYTLNDCTSEEAPAGMLAVLKCGQNPDPTGPVVGEYMLFGNATDLASGFSSRIKDDALANCGDTKSPTSWHQGSTGATAGQVACGTSQDAAEIIWTTDAKNVLSYIRASDTDVPALYQWWRTNG